MSVEILNSQQINDNINREFNNISEATTKALIKIGGEGARIIKLNTPVKSGRLRKGIGYTIDDKVIYSDEPVEPNDKIRANKDKFSVVIGTNVIYAPKIEFVPSKSKANLGFMTRGFKQLKPIAMRIFEEFLKGAIDR